VPRRFLGTLAGLALPLAAAAPAAACGGPHRQAARGHAPGGRAPLVLGDSTLILAAPALGRLGLEADAQGCRNFAQGTAILAARRRAGRLPGISVLALGANAPLGTEHIEAALGVLGRDRILGVVTPRNNGEGARAMRLAAGRHPDRVLLLDWARVSAGHGEWFAGDGLHVTWAGARIFARFLRRRVAPFAFPPVRRLRLPRTTRGIHGCATVRAFGRRLRVYVLRGAVPCDRARTVARRAPLHPPAGWRSFDWRRTGAGPWSWVVKRRAGHEIVATIARARRPRPAEGRAAGTSGGGRDG
jgi:hypothetical protein